MSRQGVAPGCAPLLAAAGLSDLDPLADPKFDVEQIAGAWRRLSKPGLGRRERWRWEPPSAAHAVMFVKRYLRPTLREQFDRVWRQTLLHGRAGWEFHVAQRLQSRYFPSVAAVGFVERVRTGWERGGAVLLAAAPGDAFDRAWRRLRDANAPITRGLARHDIAVRLGRFIAAFHQSGFCHRDLYLCHVFAELDPEAERPPNFTLIDLARAHRPRLRRMRWLLKDLSQLDYSSLAVGASRTDRLRFLLAYLGLQRGAPRVRWYARRIQQRSHRILQRERRKGRA